jgi:hypothetical protein
MAFSHILVFVALCASASAVILEEFVAHSTYFGTNCSARQNIKNIELQVASYCYDTGNASHPYANMIGSCLDGDEAATAGTLQLAANQYGNNDCFGNLGLSFKTAGLSTDCIEAADAKTSKQRRCEDTSEYNNWPAVGKWSEDLLFQSFLVREVNQYSQGQCPTTQGPQFITVIPPYCVTDGVNASYKPSCNASEALTYTTYWGTTCEETKVGLGDGERAYIYTCL